MSPGGLHGAPADPAHPAQPQSQAAVRGWVWLLSGLLVGVCLALAWLLMAAG